MSKRKQKTEWTEEKIIEIQRLIQMLEVTSLNYIVKSKNDNSDVNGIELGELLEDTSPGPPEILEEIDAKERLITFVNKLPPREMRVITLRYGLDDGKAKTLDEVGKMFGVTRERVRQIEVRGLRKLRQLIIDKNKCHTINDF